LRTPADPMGGLRSRIRHTTTVPAAASTRSQAVPCACGGDAPGKPHAMDGPPVHPNGHTCQMELSMQPLVRLSLAPRRDGDCGLIGRFAGPRRRSRHESRTRHPVSNVHAGGAPPGSTPASGTRSRADAS